MDRDALVFRERDGVPGSVVVAIPHRVYLVRAVHNRPVAMQEMAGVAGIVVAVVLVGEEYSHLGSPLFG